MIMKYRGHIPFSSLEWMTKFVRTYFADKLVVSEIVDADPIIADIKAGKYPGLDWKSVVSSKSASTNSSKDSGGNRLVQNATASRVAAAIADLAAEREATAGAGATAAGTTALQGANDDKLRAVRSGAAVQWGDNNELVVATLKPTGPMKVMVCGACGGTSEVRTDNVAANKPGARVFCPGCGGEIAQSEEAKFHDAGYDALQTGRLFVAMRDVEQVGMFDVNMVRRDLVCRGRRKDPRGGGGERRLTWLGTGS